MLIRVNYVINIFYYYNKYYKINKFDSIVENGAQFGNRTINLSSWVTKEELKENRGKSITQKARAIIDSSLTTFPNKSGWSIFESHGQIYVSISKRSGMS